MSHSAEVASVTKRHNLSEDTVVSTAYLHTEQTERRAARKRWRNHDGVTKRGFSALKVREVREHLQEDMSLNQASKQVLLSEVQRGTLPRHRHVEGGSEKNQWWGWRVMSWGAGCGQVTSTAHASYVHPHLCALVCKDAGKCELIYSKANGSRTCKTPPTERRIHTICLVCQ